MMNYKKIIEDFKSGKLKKEDHVLVLDNDACYLELRSACVTEEEREIRNEELSEKYGRGKGHQDLEDICSAAGINCEWC